MHRGIHPGRVCSSGAVVSTCSRRHRLIPETSIAPRRGPVCSGARHRAPTALPTFGVQQLGQPQLLLGQVEGVLQVVVRVTLLQGLEVQQVRPGTGGLSEMSQTQKVLKRKRNAAPFSILSRCVHCVQSQAPQTHAPGAHAPRSPSQAFFAALRPQILAPLPALIARQGCGAPSTCVLVPGSGTSPQLL